jgi:hypothetical protein
MAPTGKDEQRPGPVVLAIGVAAMLLVFVALGLVRGAMNNHDAAPASPTTLSPTTPVPPRDVLSDQETAARLDAAWSRMTPSLQINLCLELSQKGPEVAADEMEGGAFQQLNRSAVVTWLIEAKGTRCKTTLGGRN